MYVIKFDILQPKIPSVMLKKNLFFLFLIVSQMLMGQKATITVQSQRHFDLSLQRSQSDTSLK